MTTTLSYRELVEGFEPTGETDRDGVPVWRPRSGRMLDCEGCGDLFNEDTDPWAMCELDGATLHVGCHGECECA